MSLLSNDFTRKVAPAVVSAALITVAAPKADAGVIYPGGNWDTSQNHSEVLGGEARSKLRLERRIDIVPNWVDLNVYGTLASGLAGSSMQAGDAVTWSARINLEAPDSNPDITMGVYNTSVIKWTGTVDDDLTFRAGNGKSDLFVANDFGGFLDEFKVRTVGEHINVFGDLGENEISSAELDFLLYDPGAGAFFNDRLSSAIYRLPLFPDDPALRFIFNAGEIDQSVLNVDVTGFSLSSPFGYVYGSGGVSAPGGAPGIPTPGSAVLLAMAGAAIGTSRKRTPEAVPA